MWNSQISNPNAPKKRPSGRQQQYGQYGQPPPGPPQGQYGQPPPGPPQGQQPMQQRNPQQYMQRAYSQNAAQMQQQQPQNDEDNKGI